MSPEGPKSVEFMSSQHDELSLFKYETKMQIQDLIMKLNIGDTTTQWIQKMK